MIEKNNLEKYPEAFSRELMEGGYTFLKRVLKHAIDKGMPVIINSGQNYLEYRYRDDQNTFMDGVTVLERNDEEALERFKKVAQQYKVKQGVEELKLGK